MGIKRIKWLRFRIILICIVFFSSFLAIFVKGYQLQVLKRDELYKRAYMQQRRNITQQPRRGNIYDRRGEILATSVDVKSIYAQPNRINNLNYALVNLARVLDTDPHKLEKSMVSNKSFVWLKRKVFPDQVEKIRKLEIKGIEFVLEPRRFYPNRELAGHLLGFSGLDSRGLEGIELFYDDYLKGKIGRFVVGRDGVGRNLFTEKGKDSFFDGGDLVLTLDKGIQYIVEKRLKKLVQKTRAKGGTVIVMEPQTGAILAIANQPDFNPNTFWSYRPSNFRNRAVTDTFEPGSTFKPILFAAAMEEGIVKENDLFFCENGQYEYHNKVIHDVKKYGWLSFKDVAKFSSNIGATKIGEKLGKDSYYIYIKNFGFGNKTGIDLPGERSGQVRSVRSWSNVALGTASFGQGITVTALQLVCAVSAVANGGNLMKPYLVKEMVDHKGQITGRMYPEVVRRVISEKTASRVVSLMEEVVKKGGTGSKAAISGYRVAGKTGTAQKVDTATRKYSKDKYVSSFVGFVPADEPRFSILVVIDEPKGVPYGGTVAAPLFKEIASEILYYLGIPPKVEIVKKESDHKLYAGSKVGRPLTDFVFEEDQDWNLEGRETLFPNFSGMTIRQVLKVAERMKIVIEIVGSGRAVDQKPKPGTIFEAGRKFQVKFQPSSA